MCSNTIVEFILVEACLNLDRAFMKALPNNENFLFVYEFFFKELDVLFPLSLGPNQLHHDS